jgi:hypothetical protein
VTLPRRSEAFLELKAHIKKHGLKDDDLLFWYDPPKPPPVADLILAETGALGHTEPNEKGRTYPHRHTQRILRREVRLDCCKTAMADYRRKHRADDKDNPRRPRVWDSFSLLQDQIRVKGFPQLVIPAEERHRLENSFFTS